MPFPSKLSYAAFWRYSPRGTAPVSRNSRGLRDAIKNDSFLQITREGKIKIVNAIDYSAAAVKAEVVNSRFLNDYLGPDAALVPIPRSAPLSDKYALWPSRRICEALVAEGFGAEVVPLLKRKTAVQKAATAPQGMRPDPEKHYESTIIDNEVPMLIQRPITLVDDIITRGASFIGMFRRVAEAFPGRKISCFALMRTQRDGDVTTLKAPVQGTITLYPSGKLWRDDGSPQQQTLF